MLRSTEQMHGDCRTCFNIPDDIARLAEQQASLFEPSLLFRRLLNSNNKEAIIYTASLSEVRQSEAGVEYTQTEEFVLNALELATFCSSRQDGSCGLETIRSVH